MLVPFPLMLIMLKISCAATLTSSWSLLSSLFVCSDYIQCFSRDWNSMCLLCFLSSSSLWRRRLGKYLISLDLHILWFCVEISSTCANLLSSFVRKLWKHSFDPYQNKLSRPLWVFTVFTRVYWFCTAACWIWIEFYASVAVSCDRGCINPYIISRLVYICEFELFQQRDMGCL